MAPARRSNVEESDTRTALLDAAQAVMIDEGYAAVSTRRVAREAGVNNGLVYYYFGTMDELFVELFRRGAERSLQLLKDVLAGPQPLWSLWHLIHDVPNSALTMEFIALANHRKAIKAEIAAYSRKFRQVEVERITSVLATYGLDAERWPPTSIILLMSGISRFLLIEEAFELDIGHAETLAVIEREIRRLEGEWQPDARVAAPRS
jgi:AcrR family transcriptional regulator